MVVIAVVVEIKINAQRVKSPILSHTTPSSIGEETEEVLICAHNGSRSVTVAERPVLSRLWHWNQDLFRHKKGSYTRMSSTVPAVPILVPSHLRIQAPTPHQSLHPS
jgi:hypothetical protein